MKSMTVELLNRVYLDITLDILLCLLIIRNMSIFYFFILSSFKALFSRSVFIVTCMRIISTALKHP